MAALPRHGTVHLDPNTGPFVYVAGADFAGIDRFTFWAADGLKASDVVNADGGPAGAGQIAPRSLGEAVITSAASWVSPGALIVVAPGGSSLRPFLQPQGGWEVVPGHGMAHGTLAQYPGNSAAGYTPAGGFTGVDSVQLTNPLYPWGSKPVTGLYRVSDASDAVNWNGPSQVEFAASNTAVSSFAGAAFGLVPAAGGARASLTQAASHGTVSFGPHGDFTYTPKKDPATGRPYYGWDFFSYTITWPWGGALEQWVKLDVGNYVPPPPSAPAPPPQDLRPQTFSNELQGVWHHYWAAREELRATLLAMAALGEACKRVADAEPGHLDALDALEGAAADRMKDVNDAYDRYDNRLRNHLKS